MMTPPWSVESPMRAAGIPRKRTFALPVMIVDGGPTHTHVSPMQEAGRPTISTFGAPGPMIGPPTCGTESTSAKSSSRLIPAATGFNRRMALEASSRVARPTPLFLAFSRNVGRMYLHSQGTIRPDRPSRRHRAVHRRRHRAGQRLLAEVRPQSNGHFMRKSHCPGDNLRPYVAKPLAATS